MFAIIRENAARGFGRVLSQKGRGSRVGAVHNAVVRAAISIGLSLDVRLARLVLASEVFEREVATFSQLSDDELLALTTWTDRRGKLLARWLAREYGETRKLPGL